MLYNAFQPARHPNVTYDIQHNHWLFSKPFSKGGIQFQSAEATTFHKVCCHFSGVEDKFTTTSQSTNFIISLTFPYTLHKNLIFHIEHHNVVQMVHYCNLHSKRTDLTMKWKLQKCTTDIINSSKLVIDCTDIVYPRAYNHFTVIIHVNLSASTPVKNCRIMMEQCFTGSMPLPVAASPLELQRRRESIQWCYLHHLHTIRVYLWPE